MPQSESNATQFIPLPAMVAAAWGAFLYEGLLSCHQEPRRLRRVLDAWRQGCLELVIAVCLHLPEAWAQISRRWEADDGDEFPGVFEYEVIAPLGIWLGDYLLAHNGNLPTPDQVHDELRRLIETFFQPLDQRMRLALGKAS